MIAIAERVVIRADDLLSWCDATINWSYGVWANDYLKPGAEKTTNGNKFSSVSSESIDKAAKIAASVSDLDVKEILNSNIRSLKNSKLDFTEVNKQKGECV